jgi:hypothetical protein
MEEHTAKGSNIAICICCKMLLANPNQQLWRQCHNHFQSQQHCATSIRALTSSVTHTMAQPATVTRAASRWTLSMAMGELEMLLLDLHQ